MPGSSATERSVIDWRRKRDRYDDARDAPTKTPGDTVTGRSGPSLDGSLEHAEYNRGDESECNIRSYNAKSADERTYEIHWENSLGLRRART
jgi:hypothetical protein